MEGQVLFSSNRGRLGRSAPRSRTGCVTCKQRRVRCDEAHPTCGHCTRLQLNCAYAVPSRRARTTRLDNSNGEQEGQRPATATVSSPQVYDPEQASRLDPFGLTSLRSYETRTPRERVISQARSGQATPNTAHWCQSRRFDFSDLFPDLDTSWAGEFSCLFPDIESPPSGSHDDDDSRRTTSKYGAESILASFPNPLPLPPAFGTKQVPERIPQLDETPPTPHTQHQGVDAIRPLLRRRSGNIHPVSESENRRLIHAFHRIVQPPAAILIGGFDRWRRLQHYLCKLSDHSRAVRSALICVVEFLLVDDVILDRNSTREECIRRVFSHHHIACEEITLKLAKTAGLKSKTRESLLAAVFLLAWFEVIRDQDEGSSLFPQEHADMIITTHGGPWSRYSQQLLSWMNTLDSKATHLGGQHLLSPTALAVVSHFPAQIASLEKDEDVSGAEDSERSQVGLSPGSSSYSPANLVMHPLVSEMGQVKQVLLNTLIQPALDWYLTSQSYCRRISAHDKHHRERFTSDAEYEVITACKHIESELFELWSTRPAVLSLTAEQLVQVVSADIANRLVEIFSVYLASFWILFVYLHRISWWNLPHSALTKHSLNEVWQHLQRAYGEEVNSPLHKIIHPSLLWPLFMFGCECPEDAKRKWAIEQLDALGEAKPVLDQEMADAQSLPPFRLSSGATRNAKRASMLLRALIKEQDTLNERVDDRDLSMRIFGCYFSIV